MKKKSSAPESLISFSNLGGGQFGTLDVHGLGPRDVEVALGTDFVQMTRAQWIALRSVVDRFFGCESERVVLTREDGEPVVFEEREEVEDVEEPAPPPPPARTRPARRRSATA